MKKFIGTTIFCISFVSAVFSAENSEQSPFVTRTIGLGNTGALPNADTPRPSRANSSSSGRLQRADTIKVTLPRKTSKEDRKKENVFHKSPRPDDARYSVAPVANITKGGPKTPSCLYRISSEDN